MNNDYNPVDPDFHDIVEKEKSRKPESVVHYFGPDDQVEEVKGALKEIVTDKNHEEYLLLETGDKVRLDRIIVVNGKPGPAYDEYDSYALQCLDCTGGMD